jgi:serpin B
MNRRRGFVWVAVATAGLVAGCGQGGGSGGSPTEATGSGTRAVVTDAVATDAVVAATWELGVATLRSGDGPNAVASPSSLVTALAMLGEGAVGDQETAPFDAALGATGQERTDAVNALLTALSRYDGDPAVVQADKLPTAPVLHTAQRVVMDDDADRAPAQRFLDRLQQGYGAGVLVTDLGSTTGADALSAWVDENTGGLVKETAIVPDPDTVAVLQDAFVLAAAWQQPFDPDDTYDATFTVPGTGQVQAPTMSAELDVPVVERDGWTAVRLPYTDELSADLLLPPPDDPAADSPAQADAATLQALSAGLDDASAQPVKVFVPTLDLATTTDLMDLLDSLGIDGDHALTGVRADGEPVAVSQAVQQTVLKVAEDGTRAAAATEIGVGVKSAPLQVEEVRFDRPFLLVVRDGSTGWPVLLAAVTDPR